jgi:homogentisate 1,2-dioxygenase
MPFFLRNADADELHFVHRGTGRFETEFGPLDYSRTMRWVIPGATMAVLGFQTVLSSFFVSILGMRRK